MTRDGRTTVPGTYEYWYRCENCGKHRLVAHSESLTGMRRIADLQAIRCSDCRRERVHRIVPGGRP